MRSRRRVGRKFLSVLSRWVHVFLDHQYQIAAMMIMLKVLTEGSLLISGYFSSFGSRLGAFFGRSKQLGVVVAVVVPSHHRHLWALFFACLANLFLFVFYLRKINRAASLCVVLCVFFFDFPHTAMTISPTLFLSNGHRAMYVAGRSPFFFSSSSFFCSPTRENHLIWSVTTRWPTHRLRLCRKNKKRQQYGQAVEAFFFTTSNRIRQQFADLGRT